MFRHGAVRLVSGVRVIWRWSSHVNLRRGRRPGPRLPITSPKMIAPSRKPWRQKRNPHLSFLNLGSLPLGPLRCARIIKVVSLAHRACVSSGEAAPVLGATRPKDGGRIGTESEGIVPSLLVR
jgi:hypothetical protein